MDEWDIPFSLNRIARKVGMSPKKLNVLFKEKELFTPHQLVILIRVDEAIHMLLKNKLRIYEIAEACGYETTEPFSKLFKRHTGLAPKNWRKVQLSVPKGTFPYILKSPYPRRLKIHDTDNWLDKAKAFL